MSGKCFDSKQLREHLVKMAETVLNDKTIKTYRVIPTLLTDSLVSGLTIKSKTFVGAVVAYLDWVEICSNRKSRLYSYDYYTKIYDYMNVDESIENIISDISNGSDEEYIVEINTEETIEFNGSE